MKERIPEQSFIDQAKKALDDSVNDLDELTLARLRAARLQAVAAAQGRRPWVWSMLLPTGATAALVTAVLVVSLWSVREPLTQHFEDLELLASGQNLEMYEHLDFYLWLSEQEDAG